MSCELCCTYMTSSLILACDKNNFGTKNLTHVLGRKWISKNFALYLISFSNLTCLFLSGNPVMPGFICFSRRPCHQNVISVSQLYDSARMPASNSSNTIDNGNITVITKENFWPWCNTKYSDWTSKLLNICMSKKRSIFLPSLFPIEICNNILKFIASQKKTPTIK